MKIIKTAKFINLSARLNYDWKTSLDQAINYAIQKETKEPWMESLPEYDRTETQSPDEKERMVREAVEDWARHQEDPRVVDTVDGDLKPDFKRIVNEYVYAKHGVEPFPTLTEEMQAPEADELESWWK